MFKSRYNIEVEGERGELLLYNSSTGAFAILRRAARDEYEQYRRGDFSEGFDLDFMEGLDFGESFDFPTGTAVPGRAFVDRMIADGFLTILSPAEELMVEREKFDAARRDSRELAISIAPTYECNHACAYCYEGPDAGGSRGRAGKMPVSVMDAIFDYVASEYDREPFETLAVQWYGGEPSLALDVVEKISGSFLAFCRSREIVYDAMMLSNCAALDSDEACDLVASCGVNQVMVTIDGDAEMHDSRRMAADGASSFKRTMGAVRRLQERGIAIRAMCNVDRRNWNCFLEMRRKLAAKGIELSPAKLNDYYGTFGTKTGEKAFGPPAFELMGHEEFAQACRSLVPKTVEGMATIHSMLLPCGTFCRGQHDRYMVVGPDGDVYKCDGTVGRRDCAKFNISDGVDQAALYQITFDATRDPECSQCEILPLCQGNCHWERSCTGMPCHPLRTTIGDYMRDYRSMLGKTGPDMYVQLFFPESDTAAAAASAAW